MQTRNTVIMAVVLLAISGFVYFYEIVGRPEREEAERVAGLLVVFEDAEISELSVTTADGEVTATKTDATWRITAPVDVPADSIAIAALLESVRAAEQQRLVLEEAEDLAPFGLDEPIATLVLKRAEGDPIKVAVGKDTPVGASVYVRVGESRNVYSAMRPLRDEINKTLFDLRDRTVLNFASGTIQHVEYARDGLRASLRRGGSGWTAESPFVGSADAQSIDDLLNGLAAAEASAYVLDSTPDDAALAEYGLDRPAATVTLRDSDDGSYGLIIGDAAAEPAGRYAMRDGGASIFVVSADLIDELPAEAIALRDKQVLGVSRQRLAEITIARRGAQVVQLERAGVEWSITQPAPVAADGAAVSRLISALTDLRAEGFAAAGDASQGTVRIGQRDPGDEAAISEHLEVAIGGRSSVVPFDDRDDPDAESIDVVAVTPVGSDTAFLVPAAELDDILVDLFALRNKTLVEFTPDDLQTLEVSVGGTTYTLSRNGEEWTSDAGELGETTVADMLWDFNYLNMEQVAVDWTDNAPDLSTYGLAPARYRIVARDANGVVADVRIGNETPTSEAASTRVYAMVGTQSAVFEISATLADLLAGLAETLGG
jgi:hypothetical protein